MADPREIKIKLVKSLIGCSEKQRRVAQALGLYKMNQVVTHFETDIIRGMIQKVVHLVSVEAA